MKSTVAKEFEKITFIKFTKTRKKWKFECHCDNMERKVVE